MERSEYIKGEASPVPGYLLFQDVIYKFKKTPLTLTFRYAMFETNWDSRIWAYENDVLYAFSVPAYYYRGTKVYLMARIKVNRKIDIWLRYAQIYLDNRDVHGSSLNEIQGNIKSEVKAMLKIKF